MDSVVLSRQKVFGLLELDASGTVLHCTLKANGALDGSAANVAGHNFYSEVASFRNIDEFHQCLDAFNQGSEQAKSFVFNCDYEDGSEPIRVLLARIRERINGDHIKSLLIHIRKAE